jgi:CRISPR-associated protein Cas1
MKQHLNTLFVTLDEAYLAKQGEAVLVRVAKETRLRVPIHTLGGIVCFGRVGVSPSLMALCGERGVAISLLSGTGRFLAKIDGFTSGNVLLRREQYRRADDLPAACAIARNMIAAKVANTRGVLMRARRDYPQLAAKPEVERAVAQLADSVRVAALANDLDALRGIEGDAGRVYFDVFDHAIVQQKETMAFRTRSRRPPLDPVNALLSFLYAMLAHDCRAACEAVGLDPAVGFLHRDRPGRPGLALDLMEEFRPVFADRLALSLINRKQVDIAGFRTSESGAVLMDDATRKAVLIAYQKRKQEQVIHPFIGESTSLGLLPHLQARLLARHLRGDLDAYPAFFWK